jgi:hypothetical protein
MMNSIQQYRTDTGNRDYKEKMYPPTMSFENILNEAIKTNASLIVRTSSHGNKTGHWYLKAFGVDPVIIKTKLVMNSAFGLHTGRTAWVIE